MNDGLYKNKSFKSYLEIDAVNASSLKTIYKRSPKAYKYLTDNPEERGHSYALVFGELCHTRILEPERYAKEVCVAPTDDRRTKDFKDCVKDNPDKTVIKPSESIALETICDNVMRHPVAGEVLSKCSYVETNMVWNEDGMKCKARLDAVNVPTNLIIDLKTTGDTDPYAWDRSARNFGYDIQAAFYTRGFQKLSGREARFMFIVVEKEAPYDCYVKLCDQFFIDEGWEKCQKALELFKTCKDTGHWPGHSDDIMTMSASNWYFKQLLEKEPKNVSSNEGR